MKIQKSLMNTVNCCVLVSMKTPLKYTVLLSTKLPITHRTPWPQDFTPQFSSPEAGEFPLEQGLWLTVQAGQADPLSI